jgi:hypothetical protein
MLNRTHFYDVVRCWETKHDRGLVLDTLIELAKKLGRPVKQEDKKYLRELADLGK